MALDGYYVARLEKALEGIDEGKNETIAFLVNHNLSDISNSLLRGKYPAKTRNKIIL